MRAGIDFFSMESLVFPQLSWPSQNVNPATRNIKTQWAIAIKMYRAHSCSPEDEALPLWTFIELCSIATLRPKC